MGGEKGLMTGRSFVGRVYDWIGGEEHFWGGRGGALCEGREFNGLRDPDGLSFDNIFV